MHIAGLNFAFWQVYADEMKPNALLHQLTAVCIVCFFFPANKLTKKKTLNICCFNKMKRQTLFGEYQPEA